MKKIVLALISCVAVAAFFGLRKKEKGTSATLVAKEL